MERAKQQQLGLHMWTTSHVLLFSRESSTVCNFPSAGIQLSKITAEIPDRSLSTSLNAQHCHLIWPENCPHHVSCDENRNNGIPKDCAYNWTIANGEAWT